jgi:hypothetical protein
MILFDLSISFCIFVFMSYNVTCACFVSAYVFCRKEHRTTSPDQIAFCDTFKALLQQLMPYVKEHHTTGVSWNNARGVTVAEYQAGGGAIAAASAAVPAPAAGDTRR